MTVMDGPVQPGDPIEEEGEVPIVVDAPPPPPYEPPDPPRPPLGLTQEEQE
ncbi:hypothetical protein L083_5981 [Actinoplanes sp. N902-109]|nr:hypothetical protein L083_5981 [Actinoplanes sp. N902-109]